MTEFRGGLYAPTRWARGRDVHHSILVRGVDPPDGADGPGGAPAPRSRPGGARPGGAQIPEDAMVPTVPGSDQACYGDRSPNDQYSRL